MMRLVHNAAGGEYIRIRQVNRYLLSSQLAATGSEKDCDVPPSPWPPFGPVSVGGKHLPPFASEEFVAR